MKILVLQGPNLNMLGKRKAEHYGSETLGDIHSRLEEQGRELGCDLEFCQSNHEGDLIDKIHETRDSVDGIILNPAGLTGVGYPLRDALEDSGVPFVEVHLSNIHGREEFRRHSVFSAIALGHVAGFRWRSYTAALDVLVGHLKDTSA